MSSLRKSLHRHIDASAWGRKGLSPFNLAICILIIAAVALAIMETEEPIRDAHARFFALAEMTFFTIFLIEYGLRVYVSAENPRYQRRFGRLRYMASGWALLDLVALLSFIAPMTGTSAAFYLRLTRIVRIIRLSRLGQFNESWNLLWQASFKRRYELLMSALVALTLLIISSALLYLFEGGHQPEEFGSIPRALWWSIATLTTVGYGDVTPITAAGRFFAGVTAVTGIGLVAMPTGILAAAFSEAFQERESKARNNERS